MAASTRCSPGGPVPRPVPPQPMRGGGGRNGAAGTPTTYPDAVPVATHTLPLSDPPAGNRDQRGTTPSTGTGSHRRPVLRADCAMGSMSPPNSVHHKGVGRRRQGEADRSAGRVWALGLGGVWPGYVPERSRRPEAPETAPDPPMTGCTSNTLSHCGSGGLDCVRGRSPAVHGRRLSTRGWLRGSPERS